MNARRHVAALMIAGLGVAACGGGSGDTSASTTLDVTTPPTVTAPGTSTPASTAPETTAAPATTVPVTEPSSTAAPVPTFPLTGLPIGDPNLAARPALAVKINNHENARPQAGLNQADIVYEEIVEGITRFFVIFHSQDAAPIGPVRSARTTDVDLLNQLNRPLFAWSGGNRGVVNAIANANAESRAHGQAPGYYRDQERRKKYAVEHTLFNEGTAVLYTTANLAQGLPKPFFAYRAAGEEAAGDPATGIAGKMLISWTWTWEGASGQWVRTEYGAPHVDTTGANIAFENVVVQFVNYRPSPATASSPEAVTVGFGEAWVFTGGKVIKAIWERPDAAEPAKFHTESGEPIKLTPGRTWIELAEAGVSDITWS